MRLWRVRDTISEIRVNRSATRECVHVAHYSCLSTRTQCTRRLLNKQGGKNCGAPVLCWQGEVEMTYNYPSCYVCDESVTTACLFVKHDRGRSGQRLSLRGLGVNKSGRCCTVTPADSLDDAVAVFAAISYTRKSRWESFFIARHFDGHRCKSKSDTIRHHPICHLPILFLESKRAVALSWHVLDLLSRCVF